MLPQTMAAMAHPMTAAPVGFQSYVVSEAKELSSQGWLQPDRFWWKNGWFLLMKNGGCAVVKNFFLKKNMVQTLKRPVLFHVCFFESWWFKQWKWWDVTRYEEVLKDSVQQRINKMILGRHQVWIPRIRHVRVAYKIDSREPCKTWLCSYKPSLFGMMF